ncbi:hypothetical protein V1264_004059 [Littorina saxatilis]|uniref:Uncharacterized protein n=1 Tax=Littorina saxatilis TaxID=31220 RepID=A0AAN9B0U7_9CAEN
MPRLTPPKKPGRFKAGGDPEALACALNVHVSTVYHLLQCSGDIGSTAVMQRGRFFRITPIRQDRNFLPQRLRHRFNSAADNTRNITGSNQCPISGQRTR